MGSGISKVVWPYEKALFLLVLVLNQLTKSVEGQKKLPVKIYSKIIQFVMVILGLKPIKSEAVNQKTETKRIHVGIF